MLNWFAHQKAAAGWFAASLEAGTFHFARGAEATGTSKILSYGVRRVASDKAGLQRVGQELRLQHSPCATLLHPGEYQLLLVEAPKVPAAELKGALRWQVKDMLDYRVEDATMDVLDIPPDAAGTARAHMMYAVCAKNELIRERMKAFREARIPLAVIDIRETAQRNLAALFEAPGRGLAVAYFAEDGGLLTINYGGELFLARRIDIGLKQLVLEDAEARNEIFGRVALEMQRSLDHFDRQFPHVAVGRLLLAPIPQEIGLVAHLAANLTVPVERMDLSSKLAFSGEPPDAATQARLFHHFGAVLRNGAKAQSAPR